MYLAKKSKSEPLYQRKDWAALLTAFLLITVSLAGIAPGSALATDGGRQKIELGAAGKACTNTSLAAYRASKNEAQDDYWIAVGICLNFSDTEEAEECLWDAQRELKDSKIEQSEQLEARDEICAELGEAPYDPDLDPADFIDPESITAANANSYFPLVAGARWVYGGETEDGLEVITVTVTKDTKEIEYPEDSGRIFQCAVVSDLVELDGVVVEDTLDWYAQDTEGNVWYMGEIAKNYEDGELVDIEGSWQAGRDGAKPGVLMYAAPAIDLFYRQEYLLGDAEDMAVARSIGEVPVTVPYGSFSNGVLETEEWNPLESDSLELKYYAPGVGMVLELNPETGERVELVEMTMP